MDPLALFESLFKREAFQELRDIFGVIFDGALNGVMIVSKDGTTIYVNPAYTEITGTAPEMRLGKNILQLDPTCPLSRTLLTGKAVKNCRFKLCDAEHEVVANTTPVLSSMGEMIGGISVFQDFQDILRLQAELREKESAIHILKGKLSAISSAKYDFSDIIGKSPAVMQAIEMAKSVANTDVTVLIHGESGVGKEMFAHAIHANSQRRRAPFIRINCAAIPENLIESELFGFERGAFTGATQQKIGMFELANKGTILLDEIGEMSLQVQSRLLRVLEEREFYRIGGQRPVKLDIRVLTATNRNLRKLSAQGKFREDLYYRINIFNVDVPPLRERGEDILLLSQHFLETFSKHMSKEISGISESAGRLLVGYDWPGNIRELRNVIERAVVLCKGELLTERELGFLNTGNAESRNAALMPIAELERQAIQKGIDLYETSMEGKQQIARELGISSRTLYNRLKDYGLD